MKKYVKPELVYEKFELSQQIASCDFDSHGTMNDEACAFTGEDEYLGTVTIFLDKAKCEWIPDDYCLHASAGNSYNIFNS